MGLMKPPKQLPNVTMIQYPCYVQPKLVGTKFTYIPGQGCITEDSRHLVEPILEPILDIKSVVLEGILTKDKVYIIDALEKVKWEAEVCIRHYEDRLKTVRHYINALSSKNSKILDIPTDTVESAAELIELYKKYLKDGYKGCIIRDIYGMYRWEEVTLDSGEILDLSPRKGE